MGGGLEGLNLEEQSEVLVEHFEKSIKDGFGAIITMHSIDKQGTASSKEIQENMRELFSESMEYNYTSFYRLVNRLRDEFELIEEAHREQEKGPERIYYRLTPPGGLVLEKIKARYLQPLSEIKG